MSSLKEEYKKNKFLHHAYLISADTTEGVEEVTNFIEEDLGIQIKGNPEVIFQNFETLSIEEARDLKELSSRKSFSLGAKKIFVISTNFIGREAQNSMLKLFEEPTPDTHFFIITPNAETLLPTLKSRLNMVLPEVSGIDSDMSTYTKEFLKLNPMARLEAGFIKELIENKDKQKAILFLDSLTTSFREAVGKEISNYRDVFQEILSSRNYLTDRSSSVKLILESISLILPQIKK